MFTTATQLESAITRSFEDATAFHGDLGLTSGAWRDRVLTTLKKSDWRADDAAAGTFVERLHSRDLYLDDRLCRAARARLVPARGPVPEIHPGAGAVPGAKPVAGLRGR